MSNAIPWFYAPRQWSDLQVVIPLILSLLFFCLLVVVECYVALEPILPPSFLREKVPVLVCLSNFFLSVCNFSIMYFIPLWFQTVALDSASIAGMLAIPHIGVSATKKPRLFP